MVNTVLNYNDYDSNGAMLLFDNNIGYWFDVIEEDNLTLQSQITDNYIENNTAIHDNIALAPITITLKGLVGEVVFQSPKSTLDTLNKATNKIGEKLSPLTALLPPVDNITQLAKNAVQYVEASVNRYQKIIEQIRGKKPTETTQQYVAGNLKKLWQSRTACEILSPYGLYKNMYIQSVYLIQGNTKTVSNLTVMLKQLNFAEQQIFNDYENSKRSLLNTIQRSPAINNGIADGIDASISKLNFIPSNISAFNGF